MADSLATRPGISGTSGLDGNPQADNRRNIFGSGPMAPLLSAAVDQVGQTDAFAAVQCADSLLGMDFMAGQGKQVDILFDDIDGDVSYRLHCVGVEQHPVLLADRHRFLESAEWCRFRYWRT